MADLSGKTILVIGGSRGIGAAIVRRLAADGGSVRFTYAGSTQQAEALAAETGATAIRSDAADRDALIATVAAQSPLDMLVVSAGVAIIGDPLTLDADAVDRMIDLNVRAPYHASVEAARTMRDGGRIVIIGSSVADRSGFPGMAPYGLTKSALQAMARGLARDLGERGITVNVVQPGPVATDMNPTDGPGTSPMHGFMAIRRHADASEVAGMVAYLAGAEAAMVTGAMLTIDGGFAA